MQLTTGDLEDHGTALRSGSLCTTAALQEVTRELSTDVLESIHEYIDTCSESVFLSLSPFMP